MLLTNYKQTNRQTNATKTITSFCQGGNNSIYIVLYQSINLLKCVTAFAWVLSGCIVQRSVLCDEQYMGYFDMRTHNALLYTSCSAVHIKYSIFTSCCRPELPNVHGTSILGMNPNCLYAGPGD